ncbi:hypothetical protein CVT25_003541 [Psilocybe cyanescens]|uniref:Cytochrome P450 n=1 Tax=Psilocybe cyanescens TaxID=93625 RepID=A0A409X6L1_PSICY|nr:hypothetical protein CVT25_003541 [Psilocybe cyanescens]
MLLLAFEACTTCALAWLFWKACRTLFVRSSLDNIPGPPATSIWTGVLGQIFNPDAWGFHEEITKKYGSVIKIKAILGENQLYVFDPKALHQIFTKDQHIFEETPGFIEINRLVLGPGLLGTLGESHRKQRKMLNPVFSIAHMREMMPIFYSVMYRLRDALVTQVKDGPKEIDLLHWMSRAALELIGQGGLGYSFDPLTEEVVPHPYIKAIKGLGPATHKILIPGRYLLSTAVKIGTPSFRRTIVNWIPWKALHDLRDLTDVMHNVCVGIYESKKKALLEGDEAVERQMGRGKDILSILMRANTDASDVDRLPEEELLGQMSTFIFAATDTTSGALSRLFHLLATHLNVQEKLRQELGEARQKHGRDLSYDELVSLPYLDAIVRETLRLYAPVNRVSRIARQDVSLSLSNPIRGLDGCEIRNIAIPKNTVIIIGIGSCNRNPELWGPDVDEWKPERWLEPLPEAVTSAHLPGVYSNLMTFIGGSRSCIGFKFSQLEMKIVLALLVESFKITASNKEIFWRMSGIVQPTVSNIHSTNFQLPVILQSTEQ